MSSSFTFRITCRFACLVTATTAAVLILGGFLLDHEIERGFELLHAIEARELTELLGEEGGLDAGAISQRIQHDADNDAALFVIQVTNTHGEVLFRSGNLQASILPPGTGPERHWTTTLPSLGRVHLSYFASDTWRIHIGSPLELSDHVLRSYIRMCVPLLFGVALLSVGLGYAFSHATLRPIRAIEATAHRIRADNLAERIPVPSGHDELAALTLLLNQMFDRLQGSFEQVRQFSADASHELKTPLALIRLNAEKLRPRLADDPDASTALSDMLEEITRMHQVIERLLFLAKSESGTLTLALRDIDVNSFLTTFGEDADALASDRGVGFTLTRNEPGTITVEPDLLRQMLLNLVANAVKASVPGGTVRLESHPVEKGWQFTVTDEGTGVAADHLPRIFDRFVRFEGVPVQSVRAGHGLGLAICKSIVDLHHGTIQAENRPDGPGFRVVVVLPTVAKSSRG